MPEELRVRLNDFTPIDLRLGDTVTVDFNVLPGIAWRMRAAGHGTLVREEVETALNRTLERVGLNTLYDSRGEFTYDCGRREITEWAVTTNYVDVTGFGDRYARQLPGYTPPARDPAVDARLLRERDRWDAACKKADETLDRMLTEEQRKDLKEHKHFFVTGNLGTRYKLRADEYSGNVWWIGPNGESLGQFCAHPVMTGKDLNGERGRIPTVDAVIAQKLMLETDEAAFLGMANLFSGRFPPGVRRETPRADQFPGGGRIFAMPGPHCGCHACRETYAALGGARG